jgi:hypothetical protein
LVSLNFGEGLRAVAVRDEDSRLRLRVERSEGSPDSAGIQRVWFWGSETSPYTAELPGAFLVFGEMLAGSAVVELRPPVKPRESVIANGAYMMMLDKEPAGPDLFVLFRDESGAIVPWRNPAVLRRNQASDAHEPCPACGNTEWDRVEIRTGPEYEHYRHRGLVCATCGLQYGGWEAFGRRRLEFEEVGD